MAKKRKQVFESDRKMELRLRLAVKRASESSRELPMQLDSSPPPREILDRLIHRVQHL
ncbi:MAG: hypothetical protein WBR18_04200 [Anaerolineales bacterium]